MSDEVQALLMTHPAVDVNVQDLSVKDFFDLSVKLM